eukprot:4239009-Amphidinium_carterae.1
MHVRAEHEAIEAMRMANMDVLYYLDSSCSELREVAWTSIEACIEGAKGRSAAFREVATTWHWAAERLTSLGLLTDEDASKVIAL